MATRVVRVSSVSAGTLKELLHQSAEFALLDVREAGEFASGHLFFAGSSSLSRFELELCRLVPRQNTHLILCDDGLSDRAQRAAAIAETIGYCNVSILDGGCSAWLRAGYALFEGVNLPSKTFGELVEEVYHVPHLSAVQLAEMLKQGLELVLLDGRTIEEHTKMTIPGSICVPNGELGFRARALIKNDTAPIIVHCAGRTRSIIGAQTLRLIGVNNPIYALESGTQGWMLAGLELERGSRRAFEKPPHRDARQAIKKEAKKLSVEWKVPFATARDISVWWERGDGTIYLLDVRSPREYRESHPKGVANAPGGQLIQATDLWLAVRNARVVLLDDDDIRAVITAMWLRQMGWNAYAFSGGRSNWPDLPKPPPVATTWSGAVPQIDGRRLVRLLRDEPAKVVLLDARSSMSFRKAHIADAQWTMRHHLPDKLKGLANDNTIVVVPNDDTASSLMAKDLRDFGYDKICILEGGPSEWEAAGLAVESTPHWPADGACVDFAFFTHDRHAGNLDAARRYLAWETGLVARLDHNERKLFKL